MILAILHYFVFQISRSWLRKVYCSRTIYPHLYSNLISVSVYITLALLPWSFSRAHRLKSHNQQTGQRHLQVKTPQKYIFSFVLQVFIAFSWALSKPEISNFTVELIVWNKFLLKFRHYFGSFSRSFTCGLIPCQWVRPWYQIGSSWTCTREITDTSLSWPS